MSIETRIAVLEERVAGINARHDTQAMELARRLDELNHAHQQARDRDVLYLPREVHEQFAKELREKMEFIAAALSEAKGVATATARTYAIGAAITAAVGSYVVQHWLAR